MVLNRYNLSKWKRICCILVLSIKYLKIAYFAIMSDHEQPPPNTDASNLESTPSAPTKTSTNSFHPSTTKDQPWELDNSAKCGGTKDILLPIIKDSLSNTVANQGTSRDLLCHDKSHKSCSKPPLVDHKMVRKSSYATNKNKKPIHSFVEAYKNFKIPFYLEPEWLKYGFDTNANRLDFFNTKSLSALPQVSPSSRTSSNATDAMDIRHSEKSYNLMETNEATYSIESAQLGESSQHRIQSQELPSETCQSKETDHTMLLKDIPVFYKSMKTSSSTTLEGSNFNMSNYLRSLSAPENLLNESSNRLSPIRRPQKAVPTTSMILEGPNYNIPNSLGRQSELVHLSKEVTDYWNLLREAVSASSRHVKPHSSFHLPYVIKTSKIHTPVIEVNAATTRNTNPSFGNEHTIRSQSSPSASTLITTSSNSEHMSPPHTRVNEFNIGTSMIDFWSPYPVICKKSGSRVAATQLLSDIERIDSLFASPSPENSLSTNTKQKSTIWIPSSVDTCDVLPPSLNFEQTVTKTMADSTISHSGFTKSRPRVESSFVPEESVMQVSASRPFSPIISQEMLREVESTEFSECTSSASSKVPSQYDSLQIKQEPCDLCYLSTSPSPCIPLLSTTQVSVATHPSSRAVVEELVHCPSPSNSSIAVRVNPSLEDSVVPEKIHRSQNSRSTSKEVELETENRRSEDSIVKSEIIKSSTTEKKVFNSMSTSGSAAASTPPRDMPAELIDFTDILDLSSKSFSNSDQVLYGLKNRPPAVTHSLETMYTRPDTPLPASVITPITLPISSMSSLSITTKMNLTTHSHLRLSVVLPPTPLTTVAPSKRLKRGPSSRELTSPQNTFEFVVSAISEPHGTSSTHVSSFQHRGAMKKARLDSPLQGTSQPLTILNSIRTSQASERTVNFGTSARIGKHDVQTSFSIVTVPQTCSCNLAPVTLSVFDRSRSRSEYLSLSSDCKVTSAGSLKPIVSYTQWQSASTSTAAFKRETSQDTLTHPPTSGTSEAPVQSSEAVTVENTDKKKTTSAPESFLIEFNEPMPMVTTEPLATTKTSISEPVPTSESGYWARNLPQLVSYTATTPAADVPVTSAAPENSRPLPNLEGTRRSSEPADTILQDLIDRLDWLLVRHVCMLHRRLFRKVWRRLQVQEDFLRLLQARFMEEEP